MTNETKGVMLDLKLATSDGVIEGYASLFDEVDLGNDVVQRGAYAKSLASIFAQGRSVKMLWQHDPAQPIGVWDEVKEDDRGLFVKGRLLLDIARARETSSLIENGALDGLSIGYRTVRASKNSSGNRVLEELDIWEVSVVTFPMLTSARVSSKQSDEIIQRFRAGDQLTEREFETMLKGALGFSNSEAERAARLHLKGQGEPVKAANHALDLLKALRA